METTAQPLPSPPNKYHHPSGVSDRIYHQPSDDNRPTTSILNPLLRIAIAIHYY